MTDGQTGSAYINETLPMRVDEEREHFEHLLLRLSAEVIGETADYGPSPNDKRPGSPAESQLAAARE